VLGKTSTLSARGSALSSVIMPNGPSS
jgi:hypothetical protein